jgi:GTP-binding protein Era
MDNALLPRQEELPANHRSGYVAIVGKPNVGKSTLLNAWLGMKIAAVSPKPQTTRHRLLGILTRPDAQAIFVDTPGLHLPRTKLGEYMVRMAREAIPDADVVLFLVDITELPSQADREIARLCAELRQGTVILVMNKVDLLPVEKLEEHRAAYMALGEFDAALCVSALLGNERGSLLEAALIKLPYGPRYYPEEQVTDQQERFIAAEIIREQLLRLLEHEVPHSTAVVVEDFKERPNGTTYIAANIYTEKDSQKGIIIGQGGAMLKRVGRDARVALEEFLGHKVFLELWVKVRKNWRHDEQLLRQLGYGGEERD